MPPTPDDIRRIDEAVAAFDRDWYPDVATKEIRRKPRTPRQRILDVLWKRKHTVFALYWWAKRNWASERLIAFSFPLRHDNMPLKGFPVKTELQGGWTIPKADLKYLKAGPLATEGLHEILVPADIGWRKFFNLAKQIAPLATITSAVFTAAANWSALANVLRWLRNAV